MLVIIIKQNNLYKFVIVVFNETNSIWLGEGNNLYLVMIMSNLSVTPQKTVVTLRSPGTSGQYWVVRLTGSTHPVTSGRTGHTQSHSPPTTAVGWATGSGRVSSHAGSRSLYKVGRHWGCLQVSTLTYSGFFLRAGTWVIYLVYYGGHCPCYGGHCPCYGGHCPCYGGHDPCYGGHCPCYGGHGPIYGGHCPYCWKS